MDRLRTYLQNHSDVVISVPAILCFIQFISGLFVAFRTRNFDSDTISQLLASADGFETVILFVIMIVLKDKKKSNDN